MPSLGRQEERAKREAVVWQHAVGEGEVFEAVLTLPRGSSRVVNKKHSKRKRPLKRRVRASKRLGCAGRRGRRRRASASAALRARPPSADVRSPAAARAREHASESLFSAVWVQALWRVGGR